MAKKNERRSGFFQGLNLSARLSEVAFLSMVQKAIDSGDYKKDYETVREFIKEELGISYDTYHRRVEAVKEFGKEMTTTLLMLDLHWRDVRMIEHMMTDEQKSSLKKGVLDLGDRKIPINEEHAEDVRIAFANMKETVELARKAERVLEKKLSGIDGEHKKGEKILLKKIEDLEAIAGTPDTPEKVIKGFERIDKAFSDLETIIRIFCWKDAKALIADDPQLQARVQGVQEQMRARVEGLIKDWDAEINSVE